MIRYRLQCGREHVFEAWFRNSSDYDEQVADAQVTCPSCGSHEITKTPMAPRIAGFAGGERGPAPGEDRERLKTEMFRVMQQIRREVEAKADYVGPRFAEEARRIHYAELPERGIYGEATPDEAQELSEEGIAFLPLPRLPEDAN